MPSRPCVASSSKRRQPTKASSSSSSSWPVVGDSSWLADMICFALLVPCFVLSMGLPLAHPAPLRQRSPVSCVSTVAIGRVEGKDHQSAEPTTVVSVSQIGQAGNSTPDGCLLSRRGNESIILTLERAKDCTGEDDDQVKINTSFDRIASPFRKDELSHTNKSNSNRKGGERQTREKNDKYPQSYHVILATKHFATVQCQGRGHTLLERTSKLP